MLVAVVLIDRASLSTKQTGFGSTRCALHALMQMRRIVWEWVVRMNNLQGFTTKLLWICKGTNLLSELVESIVESAGLLVFSRHFYSFFLPFTVFLPFLFYIIFSLTSRDIYLYVLMANEWPIDICSYTYWQLVLQINLCLRITSLVIP